MGPRAQCDKPAYANWVKEYVEKLPNVFPVQGDVVDLLNEDRNDTQKLQASNCGMGANFRWGNHCNDRHLPSWTLAPREAQTAGGRMGDGPGLGLSESFRRLGLRLGRMKTGTPMRIHADSADWSVCEEQPGDAEPIPFAFESMHNR